MRAQLVDFIYSIDNIDELKRISILLTDRKKI